MGRLNRSVVGLALVITLLFVLPPNVAATPDDGGPVLVDLTGVATADQAARLSAAGLNGGVMYKYLPVASGNLPPGHLKDVLSLDFVKGVRKDSVRTLDAMTTEVVPAATTAIGNTWNLDFINKEKTDATGEGVYVALLDAGLLPNWRDILNPDRVRVDLGRSFTGHNGNPTPDQLENDRGGHGTATAATILGYTLHDKSQTGQYWKVLPEPATGTPGDYFVPGVAPMATIIPIKVCSNGAYCFDSSIYSAWDYVLGLRMGDEAGGALKDQPIVINMSLGGSTSSTAEEALIEGLVAHDILIVASAGNEGPAPMGWPGAYPVVISAGAGGWKKQFCGNAGWSGNACDPTKLTNQWWKDDVTEIDPASEWFMVWWSGVEKPALGQELDVVAPGRFMLLPYIEAGRAAPPSDPTPPDGQPSMYLYISGTSFSAPTTTGVVALMLQGHPGLTQAEAEQILHETALPIPAGSWTAGFPIPATNSWDASKLIDPLAGHQTGWGLVQADAAVTAAWP